MQEGKDEIVDIEIKLHHISKAGVCLEVLHLVLLKPSEGTGIHKHCRWVTDRVVLWKCIGLSNTRTFSCQ